MLKIGPFMNYQQFKKKTHYNKQFLHTFCPKRTFCYETTFIESLITHKRFIFEESYILNGKRQKSCTLIVILVKCLYLTSPTFNSSPNRNTGFFIANKEVVYNKILLKTWQKKRFSSEFLQIQTKKQIYQLMMAWLQSWFTNVGKLRFQSNPKPLSNVWKRCGLQAQCMSSWERPQQKARYWQRNNPIGDRWGVGINSYLSQPTFSYCCHFAEFQEESRYG